MAFLVLGIGLLGVAKVLLASHQSNTANYFQIQAAQFAQNIIESMHQNPTGVTDGAYVFSLASGAVLTSPSSSCVTSVCSPDALAAYDLWQWATAMQVSLPNVNATVSTALDSNGDTTAIVTINWADASVQNGSHIILETLL